ncbi:MAG: hypothetical protein J1E95_10160 [Muribaculaceae bacterium]|nr:hypothetical protein [Muribaculaceae bacterium]
MMKKQIIRRVGIGGLVLVMSCVITGCNKVDLVGSAAKEALAHGKYKTAMKTLLELSDNKLGKNDSLMLMLSEAYYGLNNSSETLSGSNISDMDFTPGGTSVVFTDLKKGKLLEYSYPELRFKREIKPSSPCYGIDISEDGSMIAAVLSDGNIELYDYKTGNKTKTLKGHTNNVSTVVFLDSNHLMSGSRDQNVIIWDIAKGEALDKQWQHRKNVKSLRRSNDGRFVVSASNDGTAIVWQYGDDYELEQVRKVKHGPNYVNDAMLSGDNKFLVTVSGDGDVKIWDTNPRIPDQIIECKDGGGSVDISPDGKLIAVGAYSFVHIINTETWKEETKYPISNDPVWAVEFLDNDKFAFVDSKHYYEVDLLRGQALIDAARKWLETHKD